MIDSLVLGEILNIMKLGVMGGFFLGLPVYFLSWGIALTIRLIKKMINK